MPSVPQILRMRQVRRQQALRSPYERLGLACAALFSLFAAFSVLALAAAYGMITRDLPDLGTLPGLLDPPGGLLLQPTRFYDRTGEHVLLSMEHPAAAQKQYLSFDQIPTSLVSATIAALEPGFWQSPGFSLAGLNSSAQTTIAQRLVSDLVFWDEPIGIRRAVRERVYAAQITARFGREQVLTWYLNSASFGRLAFGADAASHAYFGKPASQLNLSEAALLAAIAQAPRLDSQYALGIGRENRDQVLKSMADQGLITRDQAKAASRQALNFQAVAVDQNLIAPGFLSLVIEELAESGDLSRLERGGMRVITTIDYRLQAQATCAAQAQVGRLVNNSSSEADPACQAAQLLPVLPGLPSLPASGLEAGAIVLDPVDSQVLALVDSLSMQGETVETNGLPGYAPVLGLRPLQAHPPGSLVTPFVYFTAFTRGWSPASLVWDIPLNTAPALRTASSLSLPQDERDHYGPMRLRLALANDTIAPVIQILDQVGRENIDRTVRQFGLSIPALSSTQAEEPSPHGGEITLLQAAQAFSVFAGQGILAGRTPVEVYAGPIQSLPLKPLTILKVEDAMGKLWRGPSPLERRPVTSPQLAYLITHILSDETARWRSLGHPNLLEVGRPAAVKLGRSSYGENTWAFGYTPNLVVGLWLGVPQTTPDNPSRSPIPPEIAAGLWRALFQTANQTIPPQGWAVPPDIITQEVCDLSGLLPSRDCPTVVNEVFLAGNEPVQADTLYRRVQINRETGRLATIFTPPALMEEKVFINTPPEAAQWAEEAGLPVPPDTYDIIPGPLSTTPEVEISSPEMFDVVGGKVVIQGKAAGEGFSTYRLQAGEGLNPREWVQIGQDASKPAEDGQLAIWDTRGFSGLYALQLLVVRESQRVDTAVIQVTVDNEPPKVELTYPSDGQIFQRSQQDLITFQVEASDDLGLESVEFFVNGRSIRKQAEAPYALPWTAIPGTHSLKVAATDLAGNSSQASIEFVVK